MKKMFYNLRAWLLRSDYLDLGELLSSLYMDKFGSAFLY